MKKRAVYLSGGNVLCSHCWSTGQKEMHHSEKENVNNSIFRWQLGKWFWCKDLFGVLQIMPCQSVPTLPMGKANSEETLWVISYKGEGCFMWQVTAKEWICCKELKVPRSMIRCQKTFEHHPEREQSPTGLYLFTAIFLTLNWLPSPMSL